MEGNLGNGKVGKSCELQEAKAVAGGPKPIVGCEVCVAGCRRWRRDSITSKQNYRTHQLAIP